MKRFDVYFAVVCGALLFFGCIGIAVGENKTNFNSTEPHLSAIEKQNVDSGTLEQILKNTNNTNSYLPYMLVGLLFE